MSIRFCLIVFLALTAIIPQVSGQARLGIKGGLSGMDAPSSSLTILDEGGTAQYGLSVDNAKYGIQLGMFVQAQFSIFFIQPELLFNSQTIDYKVENLNSGLTEVKDESYRSLDIPFIVGFKFGPVRLGGGPAGHLYLDNSSDLQSDLGDELHYKQDFDRFTLGWQAGIGLDIWKLHLDARYEGNLDNFGGHFVFYDRPYEFDDKPSRILVSAGISF